MKKSFIIFFIIMWTINSSCSSIEKLKYKIVDVIPHYSPNFTQGLVYSGGLLYESTGQFGQSSLKVINPENGKILNKVKLSDQYFAEGLAYNKGVLTQLTWYSGRAFQYAGNLREMGVFFYNGEGWGLTSDKLSFIMSNGSEYLYYRDLKNFTKIKKIKITYNKNPLKNLNELEYVNGSIYANVWLQNLIYKINPVSGKVESIIDLTAISEKENTGDIDVVLNGIAYCPEEDYFFITGKKWKYFYKIKILNE